MRCRDPRRLPARPHSRSGLQTRTASAGSPSSSSLPRRKTRSPQSLKDCPPLVLFRVSSHFTLHALLVKRHSRPSNHPAPPFPQALLQFHAPVSIAKSASG